MPSSKTTKFGATKQTTKQNKTNNKTKQNNKIWCKASEDDDKLNPLPNFSLF